MNEKSEKLRRISFKPMFLLSLLTNKDSYNTQIIHCVNDTIFRKQFRVPGFGTSNHYLLHVRLTELHAAHQNLPPAIRTLRLKETIQNIHQKRTKSDNMIRT